MLVCTLRNMLNFPILVWYHLHTALELLWASKIFKAWLMRHLCHSYFSWPLAVSVLYANCELNFPHGERNVELWIRRPCIHLFITQLPLLTFLIHLNIWPHSKLCSSAKFLPRYIQSENCWLLICDVIISGIVLLVGILKGFSIRLS